MEEKRERVQSSSIWSLSKGSVVTSVRTVVFIIITQQSFRKIGENKMNVKYINIKTNVIMLY